MLMWWEQDGQTRLAVLYIESFGNPRKFARTARRVGRADAGAHRARRAQRGGPAGRRVAHRRDRHPAGHPRGAVRAGGDHRHARLRRADRGHRAARHPAAARRAHASRSCPTSAAPGVLAADACTDLGLAVHHPRGQTRRRLHALVPGGGAVTGPVDTTATVSGDEFRQVLELLAADEDVDALIALVLPTGATGDLIAAIQEAPSVGRPADGRGAQPAGGGPAAGRAGRQGPRLRVPGGGGGRAGPRRQVRGVAGGAAHAGARLH